MFVLVYMDDIHIFSRTFEKHLVHLFMFLKTLKKVEYTIKASKTIICQRKIEYLRHCFEDRKVSITIEQKMKAMDY